MCGKIILCAFFSLVSSSACWSQEVSSDTPTLTPKEQALQLLDSLEANSNDQATLTAQSQAELQTQLENSAKLKDSLKKTASYSESLERSLNLSLMVNKIAVPVGAVALLVAVVEGIYLVVHK